MAIPPQIQKLRSKKNKKVVEDALAIVQGDSKKAAAIGKALQYADAMWVQAALNAVFRVACNEELFTTDSVWTWGDGLPTPREPRAMGSVMRVAEKAGWIEPTREHWLSKRPVCHRRPLRVWESRLVSKLPREKKRK